MITRDDLKKWKARATMHLDGEDFYENHFACNEEPRLTYVDSGPRRCWGGSLPVKRKHKRKSKEEAPREHARKFFVDGIECPDIDAVLTMLNAEPRTPAEQTNCDSVQETENPQGIAGKRHPG